MILAGRVALTRITGTIPFYESQDTRLMGCGGTYLLGDSVLLIFCSMNLLKYYLD